MHKSGKIRKDKIGKIRSLSRFMTSQPRKQTIAIYIMSNISRSKGNQTMKFGQLIEHKLRNIFFCKIMHKNVLENLLLGYIFHHQRAFIEVNIAIFLEG